MRILQAGNANFGYVMAKELRKRGIEADLLVSYQQISGSNFSINDPKNHDDELSSYPNWMFFYDRDKKRKTIDILQKMRKYDIIHAYNTLPTYAMLSGKPYIAGTGGDDLRKKAFEKSLTGFLLNRAYKKANKVIYLWPIAKPYIEKLGLTNAEYIPRIWDVESFTRKNFKPKNDETLRLFLPTTELWELKGNDKFLRAFVKLCNENNDIFLYYVDWGKDSERAKKLLLESEIRKHVEIIPGPISKDKMREYMEKSDILVDQFNTGSFTRVGIEAFHFGIPIMINLEEALYKEEHGDLPAVLQCSTENEIYEKIKWSLENKDQLKLMSDDAKKWVMKHFDLQKNIDRYIEIYEKILKR
jgi:glycosyltransferase involved in cell wall biosynthesis